MAMSDPSATHAPRRQESPGGLRTVDICICTFRRPSVAETLRSVAAQDVPPGFAVRVIVADNDETPSARAGVEEACRALGLDLLYFHAPSRNISVARNACLDAATAPVVAFLDDDETVGTGWLRAMVAALDAPDTDVVFGPVVAVDGPGAPAWARAADFHSTRPVVRGGRLQTGYSGNVMLRRHAVGEHRFDLALGRTLGEDTEFFHRIRAGGATLRFCPDGLAFEPVPDGRVRLGWLLRRSFLSGLAHGRIVAEQCSGRLSLPAALALAKALFCAGAAAATLFSPPKWRRSLVRGALHLGIMAHLARCAAPAPDCDRHGWSGGHRRRMA
jgi:succinoglycan biosynthesis protein ExoM